MTLHVHLDPVGGIAGDMFVAALFDTWPTLIPKVIEAIEQCGLCPNVGLEHRSHHDGVFTGSRFVVTKEADASGLHKHHAWSALKAGLNNSDLPHAVKIHSIGIFEKLAEAEAEVHGKDVGDVTFHEVGNWDSVADIVAGAVLIDALKVGSWSVGSLPTGSGRVSTAHGDLPIPAPATSLLMKGFLMHDDGRPGERVTPTGAAILSYLQPSKGLGTMPRMLSKTGFGFGTRTFDGMSNVLRVLAFEDDEDSALPAIDEIGLIEFDIDDQSGEALAVSLDFIRNEAGVLDVVQTPVLGKKGRMMSAVRVMTKASQLDEVAQACFRQTTTLGLRVRLEKRLILNRRETTVLDTIRIKAADRPGGITAKAEMDDVARASDNERDRQDIRRQSERIALRETCDDGSTDE